MERPLQEWVDLRDSGIEVAKPVALGKEQWSAWSRLKADREENLQIDAFGVNNINPDYFKAREDSAGLYMQQKENEIIDAAQIMYENGEDPKKITGLLETKPEAPENIEEYALESLAADGERNEALQDNEELQTQEYLSDTGVADLTTKQNILYTKYKDIEEGVPPLWSTQGLSQIAVDLIPLSDAFLNAAVKKGEKAGLQGLTTGFSFLFSKEARERAKKAFTPNEAEAARHELLFELTKGMNKSEYSAFIDSLQYSMEQKGWSKERQRRFFQDMTFAGSHMGRTTFVGDLFPWARGITRSSLNLWQTLEKQGVSGLTKALKPGNLKKAATRMKEVLNDLGTTSENTGAVADEALEVVGVAANHPNRAINTTFSTAMDETIKEYAARSNSFKDRMRIMTLETLTDEEKEIAIQSAVKDAQRRITPGQPAVKADIAHYDTVLNEDGSRTLVATIGHGPQAVARFATYDAADEFIKKNTKFVKGEYSVIQDGAGYLIEVRTPVKKPGTVFRTYQNEWKHYGPMKYLFGRIFQPQEIHEASITLDTSARVVKNTIKQEFKKALKGMKTTELEDLDAIIEQGQITKRWYPKEFLERAGLNEKQIKLYDLYRQHEDFNYSVYNNFMRKRLHESGYKHVVMGDEHFFGKIEDRLEAPKKFVYKDFTNGQKINLGEMSQAQLDQLKSEGKVFIKLRNAVKDEADNVPYNVIIADRDAVEALELPQYVLPYLSGGRRYYPKGTVFTKEVMAGEFEGVTAIAHPRTIGADLDKVAAKERASEINGVKEFYRAYKKGEYAKEEIDGLINTYTAGNHYFRVDGLKAFEEMLEENGGFLNWKYDTEVLEDGQVMKQVQRMLRGGPAIELEPAAVDAVEDGYDLMRDLTQGLFRHRSGQVLENALGETAKTLNFLESTDETADLTANLMLRKAYDEKYARTVRSLFYDVIDDRYLKMQQSDRDFLQNMQIARNINKADPETAQKIANLKYAIEKYEIAVHSPTVLDKWFSRTMTNLANSIGETQLARDLGVLQRNNWDYKFLTSLNPERFAKTVAYQLYLGFLSPRQYWTQAMGAKAVVDLDPKNAAKALPVYLQASTAIMTEDPEKLAHLASSASKLGMDKETFEGMVDFLKMMGCRNGVESSFTGYSGSTKNAILNFSTSFARKGEEFNDTLAAMVAFLHNRDKLVAAGYKPGEKLTEKVMGVLRETASLKDDLYVNMNKINDTPTSRAPLISFLTQFQNYGLNSLQLLFNKQFTPAQRARLVGSNLLLYGIRGTLGVEAGFNVYDYMIDHGVDPKYANFMETATQGWITDQLGVDADFSSAGPAYMSFVNKLWDSFLSGDSSIIEEAPAWSAVKTLWDSGNFASRTITLFSDFFNPQMSSEQLNKDLYHLITTAQPSSLTRAEKALLAYRTGILVNSKGDILKLNTDKVNSVLYGFGADTKTQYGTQYLYWHNMKQEDKVKGIMDGLRKDFRDWRMTGSEDVGLKFLKKFFLATTGDELDEAFKESIKRNVFYMLKYNKPTEVQTKLMIKTFAKGRGYNDIVNLVQRPDITIQGK